MFILYIYRFACICGCAVPPPPLWDVRCRCVGVGCFMIPMYFLQILFIFPAIFLFYPLHISLYSVYI